jgi:hypothetical protein
MRRPTKYEATATTRESTTLNQIRCTNATQCKDAVSNKAEPVTVALPPAEATDDARRLALPDGVAPPLAEATDDAWRLALPEVEPHRGYGAPRVIGSPQLSQMMLSVAVMGHSQFLPVQI